MLPNLPPPSLFLFLPCMHTNEQCYIRTHTHIYPLSRRMGKKRERGRSVKRLGEALSSSSSAAAAALPQTQRQQRGRRRRRRRHTQQKPLSLTLRRRKVLWLHLNNAFRTPLSLSPCVHQSLSV